MDGECEPGYSVLNFCDATGLKMDNCNPVLPGIDACNLYGDEYRMPTVDDAKNMLQGEPCEHGTMCAEMFGLTFGMSWTSSIWDSENGTRMVYSNGITDSFPADGLTTVRCLREI